VRKRDTGELFEVFSDPRSSGSAALRDRKEMGTGFRKFLEDRGEYPFKDDSSGGGGFQMRRILRVKTETLLVLALAFLIANIASFSVGVWNGKRGSADAAEPEPAVEAKAGQTLNDVVTPTIIKERVVAPIPRREARVVHEPSPGRKGVTAPPPREGRYVIRVASLGLSQTKEATAIAKFFADRGYSPTKVRRVGSNLVVEVGAFTSTKSPLAVRALRDIRGARHKFTRFKDAFFVRRK
jgi:hypothetical protein